MHKKERHLKMIQMTNKSGIITVGEMIHALQVSDMTIRRDLEELDQQGKLIRIHGGAQSLQHNKKSELSHTQKKTIHVAEKKEIAQKMATFIQENDTIFLGTGTTLEMLADFLSVKHLRIITNSLPVFESLQQFNEQHELILIGGKYRRHTGVFIGSIANEALSKLSFDKVFVSANGMKDYQLYTADAEEGYTHTIILQQAKALFVVVDHYKLDRDDFYQYYELPNTATLITDSQIPEALKAHYEGLMKVVIADAK
ncbi:DeoR/GlpR family DNA-binding transcription regulator [Isobaculum melis]|uniref:Lactose phosphotransferase system repressor n=1 Tax=Isobaculum melis TaxID=142588 RepID=A0A1H9UDU9_9LACT|nr:DeoR/GlpR family DNA-binding transcription regulator [Isobaculum melis]SES07625.1 transcriptional regulator, DeoR family [Isobaculum melis]